MGSPINCDRPSCSDEGRRLRTSGVPENGGRQKMGNVLNILSLASFEGLGSNLIID